MIEYLASFATFLFIWGTFDQTRKVIREGHANGVATGFIWRLAIGFIIMCFYVPMALGWNWILLSGYIIQLILICIIAKYKYSPRKGDN